MQTFTFHVLVGFAVTLDVDYIKRIIKNLSACYIFSKYPHINNRGKSINVHNFSMLVMQTLSITNPHRNEVKDARCNRLLVVGESRAFVFITICCHQGFWSHLKRNILLNIVRVKYCLLEIRISLLLQVKIKSKGVIMKTSTLPIVSLLNQMMSSLQVFRFQLRRAKLKSLNKHLNSVVKA